MRLHGSNHHTIPLPYGVGFTIATSLNPHTSFSPYEEWSRSFLACEDSRKCRCDKQFKSPPSPSSLQAHASPLGAEEILMRNIENRKESSSLDELRAWKDNLAEILENIGEYRKMYNGWISGKLPEKAAYTSLRKQAVDVGLSLLESLKNYFFGNLQDDRGLMCCKSQKLEFMQAFEKKLDEALEAASDPDAVFYHRDLRRYFPANRNQFSNRQYHSVHLPQEDEEELKMFTIDLFDEIDVNHLPSKPSTEKFRRSVIRYLNSQRNRLAALLKVAGAQHKRDFDDLPLAETIRACLQNGNEQISNRTSMAYLELECAKRSHDIKRIFDYIRLFVQTLEEMREYKSPHLPRALSRYAVDYACASYGYSLSPELRRIFSVFLEASGAGDSPLNGFLVRTSNCHSLTSYAWIRYLLKTTFDRYYKNCSMTSQDRVAAYLGIIRSLAKGPLSEESQKIFTAGTCMAAADSFSPPYEDAKDYPIAPKDNLLNEDNYSRYYVRHSKRRAVDSYRPYEDDDESSCVAVHNSSVSDQEESFNEPPIRSKKKRVRFAPTVTIAPV